MALAEGTNVSGLGPDDLVLHAGTCQHRSFRELCETAVAGGFRAVTIYASHYRGAHAEGPFLYWLWLKFQRK